MTPMVLVETPLSAASFAGGGVAAASTGEGEANMGLFAQLLETAQQQLPFVLEEEIPPVGMRLTEQRRLIAEKNSVAEAMLMLAYSPAVLSAHPLGSQSLGELPELQTSFSASEIEVKSLWQSPLGVLPESPQAKQLASRAVSDEVRFSPGMTVATLGQRMQPHTVAPALSAEEPLARGNTGYEEQVQKPSVPQPVEEEAVSPTVARTWVASPPPERSAPSVGSVTEFGYSEPSLPTPPRVAAPQDAGRPPLHMPQSPSEPSTSGRYAAPQPIERSEQVRVISAEIPADPLPLKTTSPAQQASRQREGGTMPDEPMLRSGTSRIASFGNVHPAIEPVARQTPVVGREGLPQEDVADIAVEAPRLWQRAEPVSRWVTPHHTQVTRSAQQEVSSASPLIWQQRSPQGEVQRLGSVTEETVTARAIPSQPNQPSFPNGQVLSEPTAWQNRIPVERQTTATAADCGAPAPRIETVVQGKQTASPLEPREIGPARAETSSVWSVDVSSPASHPAGASTVREGRGSLDASSPVSYSLGAPAVQRRLQQPEVIADALSMPSVELRAGDNAAMLPHVTVETAPTMRGEGEWVPQPPNPTDTSEPKPTEGVPRRVVVLQDTALAATEDHLPLAENGRIGAKRPEPVATFRANDVVQQRSDTSSVTEQAILTPMPAAEQVSTERTISPAERIVDEGAPPQPKVDEPPASAGSLPENPSVQEEITSSGRVYRQVAAETTPHDEPGGLQAATGHIRPVSSREASPATVAEVRAVEASQPMERAESTVTEAIPSSRTAPGLLSGAPTAEAMKTQMPPSASTVEPAEGEAAPLKTERATKPASPLLLGQGAETEETVPLASIPSEKGKPQRLSPKASHTEDAGVEAVSLLANQATTASAGTDRVVVAPSQQEVSRVVQQVARHLEEMVHTRAQSLTLQLHPEELGQLRITVTLREGSIHTYIVADSSSVRQILESNLSQLHHALQQRGLQLGALQVSVQGDGRQSLTQHQPYVPTWLPANPLASTAADGYDPSPYVGGVNLLV